MPKDKVVIAGGGIGGLTLALTLHQIGVECIVFESVLNPKARGVGINLQPNAVREMFDLGFTAEDLNEFGVQAKEWALLGLKGQEIYSEPRGLLAGYSWPQYALHRGEFHMALYRRFRNLAGDEAIRLGCRAKGYQVHKNGTVSLQLDTPDGPDCENGTLLVGADGIHSEIRAAMFPNQPPIHWGGSIMWRGTSMAKPIRTKSSFIGLGTHRQRMVIYPISEADPITGLALINWIAEVTYEDLPAQDNTRWFRRVGIENFIHYFENWTYDWLDVPALIRETTEVFENPMIDRDPIPRWVEGPVALLGDAAHPMYPTGSNGASQAIVDGRVLGAKFLQHGVTQAALQAYNNTLCNPISEVVLRNRDAGPFGLLNMVNERSNGEFECIDEVISASERSDFMAKYQAAAGFARDVLNSAPPTIRPEHRIAQDDK